MFFEPTPFPDGEGIVKDLGFVFSVGFTELPGGKQNLRN